MNYEKPDPKALTGWRISRLIRLAVFLVLGIGACLAVTLIEDLAVAKTATYLISAGIVLLSLIGLMVFPAIEYRQWKYLITEEKVEIVHGIFFVSTSIVPIIRIQHITMGQGPIYRKLGLYTVTIALASGTFDIVGLREQRAREISENLRAKLYVRLGVEEENDSQSTRGTNQEEETDAQGGVKTTGEDTL